MMVVDKSNDAWERRVGKNNVDKEVGWKRCEREDDVERGIEESSSSRVQEDLDGKEQDIGDVKGVEKVVDEERNEEQGVVSGGNLDEVDDGEEVTWKCVEKEIGTSGNKCVEKVVVEEHKEEQGAVSDGSMDDVETVECQHEGQVRRGKEGRVEGKREERWSP